MVVNGCIFFQPLEFGFRFADELVELVDPSACGLVLLLALMREERGEVLEELFLSRANLRWVDRVLTAELRHRFLAFDRLECDRRFLCGSEGFPHRIFSIRNPSYLLL
ncbi:MAG: hypothetical protein Q7S96_01035 [bacterium]|nr:hypothetical protein [bacterium]